MEDKLRKFLEQYIGRGHDKSDTVTQEAVDMLVSDAIADHREQKIIDYGTDHPDAPFWDFLYLLRPGIGPGVDLDDFMNEPQEKLKSMLTKFIGEEKGKESAVCEDDVDTLLRSAISQGLGEEMTDYIKENPEVSFWELHELLDPRWDELTIGEWLRLYDDNRTQKAIRRLS